MSKTSVFTVVFDKYIKPKQFTFRKKSLRFFKVFCAYRKCAVFQVCKTGFAPVFDDKTLGFSKVHRKCAVFKLIHRRVLMYLWAGFAPKPCIFTGEIDKYKS